jgi:hypothetical protein
MKNKIYRTLLISLVFAMGKSIFAEAKPLPDFNAGTVNWGTQRYKFILIKKEEKIEMGSVTLRNKFTRDRVILTDEYLLRFEGKPMSLNMTQVCRMDQYLSPVKIECKGKGNDEFETFKATIKDGQAKIEGQRNGMMEIPKGTVTSSAFMRIVTQLPRFKGATYRYDFALEASEMNLKKEYLVKVIGKETIDSNGPVKCWKISQNGVGIGEQLFWVTEGGILQRILMDGRKQIDLQTGEPGD